MPSSRWGRRSTGGHEQGPTSASSPSSQVIPTWTVRRRDGTHCPASPPRGRPFGHAARRMPRPAGWSGPIAGTSRSRSRSTQAHRTSRRCSPPSGIVRDVDAVLVPGFPLIHRDHRLVSERVLASGLDDVTIGVYVEQPYRHAEASLRRVTLAAELRPYLSDEPRWEGARSGVDAIHAKQRAVSAYRSQLRWLELGGRGSHGCSCPRRSGAARRSPGSSLSRSHSGLARRRPHLVGHHRGHR